ncbi:MAG: deoxyribose-phosphate aldolase [Clostridiaceae bacterium]|nr:deoxyribose-phosphate aldolase [Clostridiaceae bacterium]
MTTENNVSNPPPLTAAQLAGMIDHSLLKPDATIEQVKLACETARQWKTASVCVRPSDVSLAADLLRGSKTVVSTVIGFPHGTTSTAGKLAEIRQAAQEHCREVDMVINPARLLSGDLAYVKAEIASCVQQAQQLKMKIKIILETCYLTPRQIIEACHICEKAGADFVKTSTGFAAGGARQEDVTLMRKSCKPEIGIKASGGIKNLDLALAMIACGATRIGTSSTIKIIEEARALEQSDRLATLWESCYDRVARVSATNTDHIGGDPGMTHETYYCPLLSKDILDELCQNITYATEGRISRDRVTEVSNWSAAERICADCVNAYWNKNDMPAPKLTQNDK